jgi:hypothetical protein
MTHKIHLYYYGLRWENYRLFGEYTVMGLTFEVVWG